MSDCIEMGDIVAWLEFVMLVLLFCVALVHHEGRVERRNGARLPHDHLGSSRWWRCFCSCLIFWKVDVRWEKLTNFWRPEKWMRLQFLCYIYLWSLHCSACKSFQLYHNLGNLKRVWLFLNFHGSLLIFIHVNTRLLQVLLSEFVQFLLLLCVDVVYHKMERRNSINVSHSIIWDSANNDTDGMMLQLLFLCSVFYGA